MFESPRSLVALKIQTRFGWAGSRPCTHGHSRALVVTPTVTFKHKRGAGGESKQKSFKLLK